MNMPSLTERAVFLTFDDGPDPAWTPRILDLLAEAEVTATFFMIGEEAQRHGTIARRVRAAGHGIGNHTWSHRHPFMMGTDEAKAEVSTGARAIEDAVGESVTLFRPPHGRVRSCMVEEAGRCGEVPVPWDVSAVDWGLLGTRAGIASRLDHVAAGDIVLMHDGCRGTNHTASLADVLPNFLGTLKERHLQPRALGSHEQ